MLLKNIFLNRSNLSVVLILGLLISASASQLFSQKKTIILVRHAEKSATGSDEDMAKGDPELSPDGKLRAERLARTVKRYRPQTILATEYKRSRQTAEPIAKLRGRTIELYDASKQAELRDRILSSKSRRYLIVGHSNTIPALANALFKKEIFKQLTDTEYGVFWVIRIKNGQVRKVEVFPY